MELLKSNTVQALQLQGIIPTIHLSFHHSGSFLSLVVFCFFSENSCALWDGVWEVKYDNGLMGSIPGRSWMGFLQGCSSILPVWIFIKNTDTVGV